MSKGHPGYNRGGLYQPGHPRADVLRDEGEQYANKLREAGVAVPSLRVAGMVHDFLLLDSLREIKAANIARKLTIDFLHDVLN
ncbi:hypothetical protein GCM10027298_18900 [Epidermidibacterium keratini]|nr:alpha/beta hydrolase fold domain-containing protein [Epidermidibacterium keratini]